MTTVILQHLANATALEIVAILGAGCITAWVFWRVKSSQALRQAIDNSNAAVESYRQLLAGRDKEVDELKAELTKMRTELTAKIVELEHKIDLLIQENVAYRAAKVAGEERLHLFRELMVWIRTNCPQQCEVAKLVQERIRDSLDAS